MSKGPQVVSDNIPYGVYVWRINGKTVIDQDHNMLVAPARRGDVRVIKKITDFVRRELDIQEGEAVFMEGVRPISDDEWEDQKARQAAGLVPDPYDLGNLIEEQKFQKELDGR